MVQVGKEIEWKLLSKNKVVISVLSRTLARGTPRTIPVGVAERAPAARSRSRHFEMTTESPKEQMKQSSRSQYIG